MNMSKLNRSDLWSLEEYSEQRPGFRQKVMQHKKSRQLALGENARLYFEDTLTIRYQVQEMLRIEKVFEADGIQEELDAYNPLIPDGHNWKATFMLEYPDVDQRQQMVQKLVDIENKVWMKVGECEKVFAIADEDLERSDGNRTSTVHFMRFELSPAMITAALAGEAIFAGIDHPEYAVEQFSVDESVRASLAADLVAPSVN